MSMLAMLKRISLIKEWPTPSLSEMSILWASSLSPRMAIGELADDLQLPYPQMSRAFTVMENLDLVCRVRSMDDKRVILIGSTPRGEEVLELLEYILKEPQEDYNVG